VRDSRRNQRAAPPRCHPDGRPRRRCGVCGKPAGPKDLAEDARWPERGSVTQAEEGPSPVSPGLATLSRLCQLPDMRGRGEPARAPGSATSLRGRMRPRRRSAPKRHTQPASAGFPPSQRRVSIRRSPRRGRWCGTRPVRSGGGVALNGRTQPASYGIRVDRRVWSMRRWALTPQPPLRKLPGRGGALSARFGGIVAGGNYHRFHRIRYQQAVRRSSGRFRPAGGRCRAGAGRTTGCQACLSRARARVPGRGWCLTDAGAWPAPHRRRNRPRRFMRAPAALPAAVPPRGGRRARAPRTLPW
jgi:hypothetical protein